MMFRFDDADDRERASDGVSRYGVYLRRYPKLFADWEDNQVTGDPALFARSAWQVATSPTMAPPYLDWTAERVRSVDFTFSERDGSLIAHVQVAVPRPAALAGVQGFADWARDASWQDVRGYHLPEDAAVMRQPAMLSSTLLLFHLPATDLYLPQDAPDQVSVRDAKCAVKRLIRVLDERLAPVLAALDKTPIGGG
ncbi:hypothetical protein [Actinomadura rubrisoli]|uniref:Uncharacterized protein n=1 Tax=Actinomadura rubrisoli TaxID=2530368 RepID=A0A4R5CIF8_9ACTN|nr:hypothetical protein [Actinomadura rubrisoli]TDD98093.1 hypothetical protein E1298_00020 [Actinomadura rubrisoli]